jgi:hypothetical protein
MPKTTISIKTYNQLENDYRRVAAEKNDLFYANECQARRIESLKSLVDAHTTRADKAEAENAALQDQHKLDKSTVNNVYTQIRQKSNELSTLKVDFDGFKRDVSRLLLLDTFQGGRENELMLTRCRNRILSVLHPENTNTAMICDTQAEVGKTPEQLECEQA